MTESATWRTPPALNDAPSYDAPEPVTGPAPEPAPEPERAPRPLRTPETVLYRCVPTRYSPTGCYGFGIKTTSVASENGGTLPQGYRLQSTNDAARGKAGMCPCGGRITIATRHSNARISGVFRGPRHHDVAAEVCDQLNASSPDSLEDITDMDIQVVMRDVSGPTTARSGDPALPAEWVWAETWGLVK